MEPDDAQVAGRQTLFDRGQARSRIERAEWLHAAARPAFGDGHVGRVAEFAQARQQSPWHKGHVPRHHQDGAVRVAQGKGVVMVRLPRK